MEETAEGNEGAGTVLAKRVSKGCSSMTNYGGMFFCVFFSNVLKSDMAAVRIFRLLFGWYIFL